MALLSQLCPPVSHSLISACVEWEPLFTSASRKMKHELTTYQHTALYLQRNQCHMYRWNCQLCCHKWHSGDNCLYLHHIHLCLQEGMNKTVKMVSSPLNRDGNPKPSKTRKIKWAGSYQNSCNYLLWILHYMCIWTAISINTGGIVMTIVCISHTFINVWRVVMVLRGYDTVHITSNLKITNLLPLKLLPSYPSLQVRL